MHLPFIDEHGNEKAYILKGTREEAGLNWLTQILGKEKWIARRNEVHNQIFKKIEHSNSNPYSNHEILVKRKTDTIVTYLYMVDSILRYGYCHDQAAGARIFPFVGAIGENISILERIENVTTKVNHIFHRYKNDPFPFLYELIVAIYYARNNWKVSFIETKGNTKSPDLRIEKEGIEYYIECKLLSKDLTYIKNEAAAFSIRWHLGLRYCFDNMSPSFFKISFKAPIEQTTQLCIAKGIKEINESAEMAELKKYESEEVIISARIINLKNIQEHFRNHDVLTPSPLYIKLICGEFDEYSKYSVAPSLKNGLLHHTQNNALFCNSIDNVFAAEWISNAELSTQKRTKTVTEKIKEAEKQLPNDRNSIIHIGYETSESPRIEQYRLEKILDSINKYDFKNKNIHAVFINAIICFTSEDSFDCKETSIEIYKNDSAKNKFSSNSRLLLYNMHERTDKNISHWGLDEIIKRHK